jgi:hypothetical protein
LSFNPNLNKITNIKIETDLDEESGDDENIINIQKLPPPPQLPTTTTNDTIITLTTEINEKVSFFFIFLL